MQDEIKQILEETLSNLEEDLDKAEVFSFCIDIIKQLTNTCFQAVEEKCGYNSVETERAKYWHSSIRMALDSEHSYLGRCMFTMEDSGRIFEESEEEDENED